MPHILGIDIGSAATKAVLLDREGRMITSAAVPLGTGTRGTESVIRRLYQNSSVDSSDKILTVATGYGRMEYKQADFQLSEITCHAKGVKYLIPGVRTIIDIGGQDSKAIRVNENGAIRQFVMNDKCAAGTGRFLEVMSRVLELDLPRLGEIDEQADKVAEISSTCTVFAESEVISRLSQGERIPNIVAGIHQSVARRVAGLAMRVGLEKQVVLTSGVAQNRGVVRALERELKVKLVIPPNPQITGALGAALAGLERCRGQEGDF